MLRTLLTNFCIALASLAATALLCEFASRLILPPQSVFQVEVAKKEFSAAPLKQIEDQTGSIMQVMDWSGSKGVRLNPNVTALIRNHTLSQTDIEIQTNSHGLRYKELSTDRGNEKRILFIGDSITFGDYLPADKTIPNLLEYALKDNSTTPPLVINAGLPGANTSDEFHHYLELKNSIRPDLVLVGMYLNDSQESQSFYAKKLRFPFSDSRFLSFVNDRLQILTRDSLFSEVRNGAFDPNWREAFRAGRVLAPGDMVKSRDAFDFEIYNAHQDFGLAWNSQSWPNVTSIVDSFSNSVTESGSRFAVVLFPIHFQVFADPDVLSSYPQEQFRAMCSSLSIPCLDLLPTLRKAAQNGVSKEVMFYDHCHYREEGNKLVAQAIKSWLVDNKLLP